MLEIEVKIRLTGFEEVVQKLEALGAQLIKSRHFEQNSLYDFPSRDLLQKRYALRLRSVGKKTFLTFKGAVQKSRKFKIRDEYETEIKNRKQLQKILKNLGLSEVYQYQKHRTVYNLRKVKICLDETSAGKFMELEGRQHEIVRSAELLGYEKKDFIKSNYIELIEQKKRSAPQD